jgi:hypothetical protein
MTSLRAIRSLSASRRRSSGQRRVDRPSRWRTSLQRYTAGSSPAITGPAASRRPNPARSGRPSRSRTAMTPSSTAPLPSRIAAGPATSGKRRARSPCISPWMRTAPPGSRKSSARAPSQSTLKSHSWSSKGPAHGTDVSIGM